MSFLSRLLGRGARRGSSLSGADAVDLVSGPRPRFKAPRRIGIDTSLALRPWSVSRLMAIFREASRFPSEGSLRDARYARHCLSRFWLAAPIDLLENLYAGAAGKAQQELLDGPLPQQDLAADETEWRQELSRRLSEDFSAPERWNLFLAAMPFYPPGGMKLDNPELQLPGWLLLDYARFCDPSLAEEERPRPALSASVSTLTSSTAAVPPPAGRRPRLWHEHSAEVVAKFEDEEFLTRQQGLLNLFAIDPSDNEVIEELSRLRRQLGQLWLDVVADQLEDLYRSSVGEVWRALLQSGFGNAPLSPDDQSLRSTLSPLVEDLERPGAIQALLAVVPFFPPGKVELEEDSDTLPDWLRRELSQLAQAG